MPSTYFTRGHSDPDERRSEPKWKPVWLRCWAAASDLDLFQEGQTGPPQNRTPSVQGLWQRRLRRPVSESGGIRPRGRDRGSEWRGGGEDGPRDRHAGERPDRYQACRRWTILRRLICEM